MLWRGKPSILIYLSPPSCLPGEYGLWNKHYRVVYCYHFLRKQIGIMRLRRVGVAVGKCWRRWRGSWDKWVWEMRVEIRGGLVLMLMKQLKSKALHSGAWSSHHLLSDLHRYGFNGEIRGNKCVCIRMRMPVRSFWLLVSGAGESRL